MVSGAITTTLLGIDLPIGLDVETDAVRVDLLAELELVKNIAAGLQAQLAVDLDRSVRSQDAAAGVPAERRGRGVAAQIGLARAESPHRAAQLLGLAKDLATDLPLTRAAMREGRLSEYRATLLARETGCLDSHDRQHVDEQVMGEDDTYLLGTRQLAAEIRRRVYAADPAAVARRAAKAAADRCVTVRPAPDTMTYLTAHLPVAQGVAVYAALIQAAAAAKAEGDERGKGQLMADILVERLTGQAAAPEVPLTIDLVISDQTLFGSGPEPADVPGYGPVPAQTARDLIADALDAETLTYLRRLYTDPAGHLVAMSTRQRFTTEGLSDFLRLRDQGTCRTPWCDAPIAHDDHIDPAGNDGQTTSSNTQGLCQACNHAKQATGWRPTSRPRPRRRVPAHRRDHHPHRPPTSINRTPTTDSSQADDPGPLQARARQLSSHLCARRRVSELLSAG